MTNQLAFHNTKFNVINHNNQIWLTAVEIAKALCYKSDDAVTKIYNRNIDEFSPGMSETVNLGVSGNLSKSVRIFSLRGAHLIAMFARTPVAKEFRCWVLDILDREVRSAGADHLPTKFHQRVLLYLNENGQVKDTYPLTEDQVVMSFDAFVGYFRKKGWIVAPRDEVLGCLVGAVQKIR
ncbi:BRO-N domain-containing protein [Salmonella enterica]|uniref:BRO-N domain-containing protein n=1 Tax=Salmonella enterica TaxID=28901 RepID=UPI0009B056B2|nr:BRO family protein [Salmonella enterica]EEF0769285.1 hypothetical protein [Salmonella enterica subsp. enterica serovar Berta]